MDYCSDGQKIRELIELLKTASTQDLELFVHYGTKELEDRKIDENNSIVDIRIRSVKVLGDRAKKTAIEMG